MPVTLDSTALATPDTLHVSEDLIRRFDRSGPRYTSYPTADRFRKDYSKSAYRALLEQRALDPGRPDLSVYVHLPFCESLCYFCACNKIITKDHGKTVSYLETLFAELDLVAATLGERQRTVQLHLGGGTPTFLSDAELTELSARLRVAFDFPSDAEWSMEIDPRTVRADRIAALAGMGYNRVSFGVQDFNPEVQAAVNRIQPFEMVRDTLRASRESGFSSINTDLIYGLPKQTLSSFSHTLEQLLELSPDRIALYNYAHLPGRFKAQRMIQAADLPSAETRLQIFLMSLRRLTDAGYVYIGLDHFAKPDDELNRARLNQTLHRNFQGYTTRAECDLVGLGISAIGKLGNAYVQNEYLRKPYAEAVARGDFATVKGITLDADDARRRRVIMAIMCGRPIDFESFAACEGVEFGACFSAELRALAPHVDAGLIAVDGAGLRVLPAGRLFVRALAMVFDRHLREPSAAQYSRLI